MSLSEAFVGTGMLCGQLDPNQPLQCITRPLYDHLQQLQQLAHTSSVPAPRDTGLEALKPRMSLLHAMDRKTLAPHLTAALSDDRPHPDLMRDLQGVQGSGVRRCECGAYLRLHNYDGQCKNCLAITIATFDGVLRAAQLRVANNRAQRTLDDPRPMGWRPW